MKKLAFIAFISMYGISGSQPTQELKDSGWVALFNGTDFTGLITFDENLGRNQNQGMFEVLSGGILQANAIGRIGWVMTEKTYSHYNVYVEYQFNASGNTGQNAGLLHHAVDSLPLFNNRWPQSQECQGQKSGAGDLWSIGLHLTTEVQPGTRNYQPGGDTVSHSGLGGGTRRLAATDHLYQDNQWNTLEVIGRGSQYTHIVNGQAVLRGWNVRKTETDTEYVTEGNFVLQQEGANVQYRNFRVQELDPQTGLPKFGAWGCTDSQASNYVDSATMDDSSCIYIDGVQSFSDFKVPDLSFAANGIKINFAQIGNYRISVFDFKGAEILEVLEIQVGGNSELYIPLNHEGIYMVRIEENKMGIFIKRIPVLIR